VLRTRKSKTHCVPRREGQRERPHPFRRSCEREKINKSFLFFFFWKSKLGRCRASFSTMADGEAMGSEDKIKVAAGFIMKAPPGEVKGQMCSILNFKKMSECTVQMRFRGQSWMPAWGRRFAADGWPIFHPPACVINGFAQGVRPGVSDSREPLLHRRVAGQGERRESTPEGIYETGHPRPSANERWLMRSYVWYSTRRCHPPQLEGGSGFETLNL